MLSGRGIAQAEFATWLMDVPRAYFHQENFGKLPKTHLLIRGKAARPGPVVGPGIPQVLCATQPHFPDAGPYTSQRRLTLARWIVGSPLAARVIVNRIWQFHFGEGLVRTPSDFGVNGQAPTHPELLDWLATEFIRQGWSIKQLHRVILLSNTYRMSKRRNEAYAQVDPDNRFFWRFPYRRLEVEAIRDSVLLASGQLNRQLYGPSMFPAVPKEALAANSDPGKIWKASNEKDASRRTVYAFIKRSMVVPFLEVLDLCDTTRTSAQRLTTTVAPQALSLFNGDFIQRQARYLADRLEREAPGDTGREIETRLPAHALPAANGSGKLDHATLSAARRPAASFGTGLPGAVQSERVRLSRLRPIMQPTRRDFLCNAAHGFGGLALIDLLARDGYFGPRASHFPTKAKHAIFLFMNGAPSHVDTFDPKPAPHQV